MLVRAYLQISQVQTSGHSYQVLFYFLFRNMLLWENWEKQQILLMPLAVWSRRKALVNAEIQVTHFTHTAFIIVYSCLDVVFVPVDHITRADFEEKLKAFTGDIMQVPPLWVFLSEKEVTMLCVCVCARKISKTKKPDQCCHLGGLFARPGCVPNPFSNLYCQKQRPTKLLACLQEECEHLHQYIVYCSTKWCVPNKKHGLPQALPSLKAL